MINVCIDKRLAKHSHFLCLQLKKLRCREVKKISCPKQHKFVNGEEAVIQLQMLKVKCQRPLEGRE